MRSGNDKTPPTSRPDDVARLVTVTVLAKRHVGRCRL
jgi:hypothetical protein